MTIDELLKQCGTEYHFMNYKTLMGLCDEILKRDPENQTAMGYKSVGFCFTNQPQKALELLEKARKQYPSNYYFLNNSAMAYYDLGEYEKSLECCEEGLKIKEFDWLCDNKIKALIMLERIDDAVEFWENSASGEDLPDIFIECGKYSHAFKYCLDEYYFKDTIDRIKQFDTGAVGDYYMSWINTIKFRYDTESCPDCGGRLIPILWGYPGPEMLEKANRGEVFLGGCVLPMNNPDYHCTGCGHEFHLGHEGIHIECDDVKLRDYTESKIDQLRCLLGRDSNAKSLSELRKNMHGLKSDEFEAFVSHLVEIGYLSCGLDGNLELA